MTVLAAIKTTGKSFQVMESRADFAILQTIKHKELAAIGRHIDRKHFTPHVDRSRNSFNDELNHTLGTTINSSLTHLKEEVDQARDTSDRFCCF